MSFFLVGLCYPRYSLLGTRFLFCSAPQLNSARSFSHTSHVPLSSPPQHQIYISQSTNPYFNLTFEDWLFRHAPVDNPLLLVYRNAPCVIIGRNQNPWKEINFQALRLSSNVSQDKKAVPFIRRRSGGGTVYHDDMVTKAVASVPSPVCKLTSFDTSVTHEAFTDAVVREFRAEYGIDNDVPCCVVKGDEEALVSIEYMRKGMAELPSWGWSYGQTPEFTYTVRHSFAWGDVTAKIQSKHGIIQSCIMQIADTTLCAAALERLIRSGASLDKKKYDPTVITTIGSDGPTKDVMAWLQHVMAR
ncbi:hypothetical protein APHAL10511_001572 [Amanita phalloides]|nr:hypothetical protein APHAL10511_001572 [Amanita phalloides]